MDITRNDVTRGVIGLVTGGPIGLLLSPAVGRFFNDRWTPWALTGIILGPLSWGVSTVPIALLTYTPPPKPQFIAPPPSPNPAPEPVAEAPTPAADQPLNAHVANNLNAADQLFKSNMDGCTNVASAILIATSPNIYGPTSDSQRAELKRYADRCGLRF